MRIIPKNTKVSTEFFKGVTLADMIVGFFGTLTIFLVAISSLPYRGYIALGLGFVLAFLLVRIDDESNYLFIFRIIRHFSYFRSYQKPGFEYPEEIEDEIAQEVDDEDTEEVMADVTADVKEEIINKPEEITLGISSDISGDMPVLGHEPVLLEKPREKDPLQLELEEEGFEILDLDEVSVEKKVIEKPTDAYANVKKKAPQSVLGNIRERSRKAKKGGF